MDRSFRGAVRDLYQRLTEVLSLQHAHERARRVLYSIRNVLAMPDAAIAYAVANLTQERIEQPRLADEIVVYETTDGQALAQYLTQERREAVLLLGRGAAVLCDQTADRHSCELVE